MERLNLSANSKPDSQQSHEPFTYNRCDWLPEGVFSDDGYRNDGIGIAYRFANGWHLDSKFLATVNWTTPPPPRPTDPVAAQQYDNDMKIKSCTIIAINKSARYPRLEIDLDTEPSNEGVLTAKGILQRASDLYKKNKALITVSEAREVQISGIRFFQLDAELLAQDLRTHYFHRSLVSPAVNHLSMTIRITSTNLEDLQASAETVSLLRIDRSHFKLP